MIGSPEEALIASKFRVVHEYAESYPFELPPGWTFLGHGAWRNAFLSPTGVVYKLQIGDQDTANYEEYQNYLEIIKTPIPGWYVPEVDLYSVGPIDIIAMEYIEGEPDDDVEAEDYYFPEEWFEATNSWGIEDVSPFNIIIMSDGKRALIDMGG